MERALLAQDVIVLDVSLLRGAVPVVIVVLGAEAAVFLLARRSRRWWLRTVPVIALGLPFANQVGFGSLEARVPNLVIAAPGRPLEQQWTAPAGMPAGGVVSEVRIPAPISGFPARPG